MKAENKIKALKAAGVNVSNLFSMKDSEGNESIGRLNGGILTFVDEDDPVFAKILGDGTIPNNRLFRRWVMAQVFHMMAAPCGFHEAIKRKGARYSWDMVVEELRVQAKLFGNDRENYMMRNRWFNKDTVVSMAIGYIEALEEKIQNCKPRKCKGLKYIRIGGRNVFCADADRLLVNPIKKWLDQLVITDRPDALYNAAKHLRDVVCDVWMYINTPVCPLFVDAYKGAGAYFTMRNLIMFHDCKVKTRSGFLSREDSLMELENTAAEGIGYKMFGMLKQLLKDNSIDIEQKMAEWRKK